MHAEGEVRLPLRPPGSRMRAGAQLQCDGQSAELERAAREDPHDATQLVRTHVEQSVAGRHATCASKGQRGSRRPVQQARPAANPPSSPTTLLPTACSSASPSPWRAKIRPSAAGHQAEQHYAAQPRTPRQGSNPTPEAVFIEISPTRHAKCTPDEKRGAPGHELGAVRPHRRHTRRPPRGRSARRGGSREPHGRDRCHRQSRRRAAGASASNRRGGVTTRYSESRARDAHPADVLQLRRAACGDGGHRGTRRSLRDRLRDPDQPSLALPAPCRGRMRVEGRSTRRPTPEKKQASRAGNPTHHAPSRRLAAGSSPAGGATSCRQKRPRGDLPSRAFRVPAPPRRGNQRWSAGPAASRPVTGAGPQ